MTAEPPVLRPGPDGAIGVVGAVVAVVAALPAIGRDDKAPAAMGGYAFRGIEAVTREVQPLFAAHGLVVAPYVDDVSTTPAPRDGWTDTNMAVTWTILHRDGSSLTCRTRGIGRDNADKGTNKAQTQAYKYLLLHLLMISDTKDDPDAADVSQAAEGGTAMSADTAKAAMRDRATMLAEAAGLKGEDQTAYVKHLCTEAWRTVHAGSQTQLTSFPPAAMTAVIGVINTLHAVEYPTEPTT